MAAIPVPAQGPGMGGMGGMMQRDAVQVRPQARGGRARRPPARYRAAPALNAEEKLRERDTRTHCRCCAMEGGREGEGVGQPRPRAQLAGRRSARAARRRGRVGVLGVR